MQHSGSIPKSFIEDLLARADIVQVINQRVPLKKAGATYKACCPFHSEKTPSFNVNPQKQFYHCFGCGASGDALKFLMEYDGLSFVEAVETLAQMNGLQVPREQLTPKQKEQQQKAHDLYDVMHLVAKFYRQQLRVHPQADLAKSYLKNRGLSAEIAKEFVVGFAPNAWDVLEKGLKADAVLLQQLVECGMLVQKENRYYDRFRGRVMFPIRDGRGRVVAFGGRVIDDEQPKYLNSPETPIFHKSYALYGLYEMRQSRQNYEQILVVEGYMDVVSLAQFGIRNAVATLGTATTNEHLDMLFRQVNEVVFCFDGDAVGLKAAWKALDLALPKMIENRSIKFLFLAQGEDPDSTVRKEGVDGFQKRIAESMPLSQFLLDGLAAKVSAPKGSPEARHQLVVLATPFIQKAQGLYQFLLAEAFAQKLGLPTWRLEKEMGVRSGFASHQNNQQSNKSLTPAVQIKSLPFKLMAILVRRPYWAIAFEADLLTALVEDNRQEYQLLAQVVVLLQQHNYLIDTVAQWMLSSGWQTMWQALQDISLLDDDGFLRGEFDFSFVKLATELKEAQLLKAGLNDSTLADLAKLLKDLKK